MVHGAHDAIKRRPRDLVSHRMASLKSVCTVAPGSNRRACRTLLRIGALDKRPCSHPAGAKVCTGLERSHMFRILNKMLYYHTFRIILVLFVNQMGTFLGLRLCGACAIHVRSKKRPNVPTLWEIPAFLRGDVLVHKYRDTFPIINSHNCVVLVLGWIKSI